MRCGVALLGSALVVLAASAPREALANPCAGALTACINDDTLWPHAGPSRFASVGGSTVTAESEWGFGLVATYLWQPVVYNLRSPGGGSRASVVSDQGNGSLLWSYGAAPRLELDLVVPVTFGQVGQGLRPITGGAALHDTAVRDLRFGVTYALAGSAARSTKATGTAPGRNDRATTGGLAARVEVSAPTGDPSEFAGDRTGVFVPSLSADGRTGRFFGGVEIGARLRPTTEIASSRIGSQLVGALGLGVDVLAHNRLSATLEAWALPVLVSQGAGGGALVPAEWQLSAQTMPLSSRDLVVQVGGGGGIGDAVTAARMRFVLSVRWAPTERRPTPKAPTGAIRP